MANGILPDDVFLACIELVGLLESVAAKSFCGTISAVSDALGKPLVEFRL